jgi:hypothetical protein
MEHLNLFGHLGDRPTEKGFYELKLNFNKSDYKKFVTETAQVFVKEKEKLTNLIKELILKNYLNEFPNVTFEELSSNDETITWDLTYDEDNKIYLLGYSTYVLEIELRRNSLIFVKTNDGDLIHDLNLEASTLFNLYCQLINKI